MIAAVPNDPSVTEADKLALAPVDQGPGPFVDAIEDLVTVVEASYDLDVVASESRS